MSRSGFTLIELMIVLALLGIATVLAVPACKAALANSQTRTAAQALKDGLQLAREKAIHLNRRVVFKKEGKSGWTVSQESPSTQIQTQADAEGSSVVTVTASPNSASQVTFDSFGSVVANADASETISKLDINVPSTVIPADQSQDLRITLAASVIRLCDPHAAAGTARSC